MAEQIYLAMTAAEFAMQSPLPPYPTWMACHFSPYGTGLSNLPANIPEGTMLILNDRIPIRGHDPQRIAGQLLQICDDCKCSGILLDFQQPGNEETRDLVAFLAQTHFPCPVGVSEIYRQNTPGPVFLSPCPHHVSLSDHIASWQGREIWLDLAVDAETITLTESGSTIHPLPLGEIPQNGFYDSKLHCHYSIETGSDSARFTLWRTREDMEALTQEATKLGIQTFIGLFQEWQ